MATLWVGVPWRVGKSIFQSFGLQNISARKAPPCTRRELPCSRRTTARQREERVRLMENCLLHHAPRCLDMALRPLDSSSNDDGMAPTDPAPPRAALRPTLGQRPRQPPFRPRSCSPRWLRPRRPLRIRRRRSPADRMPSTRLLGKASAASSMKPWGSRALLIDTRQSMTKDEEWITRVFQRQSQIGKGKQTRPLATPPQLATQDTRMMP